MQTLSSASRTCMASASAVECTATVRMPISRQARWMRSAISPRLAIRTFSNIPVPRPAPPPASIDDQQDFAELDGAAVGEQDLLHRSGVRRRNRVHHLHGFDDEQGLALGDAVADLDEGIRTGCG